ncbi:copper amine oxidase N-terminal domain-containing protein [Paenibacillus sp. FSL L8-0463]|uniref:copper amine oxidase N-terminal domain-containing protein n=1 Tax=Paenibacillus sp. FSL L8-0463 TaxID=2954687 RepID=UPI003119702D
MKRSHKVLSSVLTAVIMLGMVASVGSAAQVAVSVQVNGKTVKFPDARPYDEGNRVMIPIRFVSEALGATVGYSNRIVTIKQDSKNIVMKVNSDTVTVDTVIHKLDVPARAQQNRTYVPLRFVSEALGAAVDWNQQTKLVTITTTSGGTVSPSPSPSPTPGTANGNNMYSTDFAWKPGYTKLAKTLFVNNMKVENGKLSFTLPKEAYGQYYEADGSSVDLVPGKSYTYAIGKGSGFLSLAQVYPGHDEQEGYVIEMDSNGTTDLGKIYGNVSNDVIVVIAANNSTATLSKTQTLARGLN